MTYRILMPEHPGFVTFKNNDFVAEATPNLDFMRGWAKHHVILFCQKQDWDYERVVV